MDAVLDRAVAEAVNFARRPAKGFDIPVIFARIGARIVDPGPNPACACRLF